MRKLNRKEKALVERSGILFNADALRVAYQRLPTHNSLKEQAVRVRCQDDAGVSYDPLTVTVATVASGEEGTGKTLFIRNGVAKRGPRDDNVDEVGEAIAFTRALHSKPIRVP